jgi:Holliday junction resolvase RusA-like endonuclease
MTPITFHVEGEPVPQPRPKARAMRIDGKWTARVYNPSDADSWKITVNDAARRHLPREPITDPVAVVVIAWLPRPLAHYGTGRNASLLKPSAPTYCGTKPDGDNLIKAILDALTTLQVWKDDSLVADMRIIKRYANGRPGADITITPLAATQLTLGEVAA